jgi:hypothetical protein
VNTKTDDWPFDAARQDPLAKLRIPVVSSPYPAWKYEVALFINDPHDHSFDPPLWGFALRPDDAEVRMITAYIEWRMEYYNEGWKAKMRKRPLDVDSSTNTVILQKRGEGDWCYRRMTWDRGPLMVPVKDGEDLDLERLLDRINDYGSEPNPKWRAFKAAHPEAFPVVAINA